MNVSFRQTILKTDSPASAGESFFVGVYQNKFYSKFHKKSTSRLYEKYNLVPTAGMKEGQKGNRKYRIVPENMKPVLREVKDGLSEHFQNYFKDNSKGWTKKSSTRQFYLDVDEQIILNQYSFAAKLDISNYFNNVDRPTLISILDREGVSKALIEAAYTEFCAEETGITQGGSVSPILGSVYLNELNIYADALGIPTFRWGDDVLIFGHDEVEVFDRLHTLMSFAKENLLLTVNAEKTKLVNLAINNISFCGAEFNHLGVVRSEAKAGSKGQVVRDYPKRQKIDTDHNNKLIFNNSGLRLHKLELDRLEKPEDSDTFWDTMFICEDAVAKLMSTKGRSGGLFILYSFLLSKSFAGTINLKDKKKVNLLAQLSKGVLKTQYIPKAIADLVELGLMKKKTSTGVYQLVGQNARAMFTIGGQGRAMLKSKYLYDRKQAKKYLNSVHSALLVKQYRDTRRATQHLLKIPAYIGTCSYLNEKTNRWRKLSVLWKDAKVMFFEKNGAHRNISRNTVVADYQGMSGDYVATTTNSVSSTHRNHRVGMNELGHTVSLRCQAVLKFDSKEEMEEVKALTVTALRKYFIESRQQYQIGGEEKLIYSGECTFYLPKFKAGECIANIKCNGYYLAVDIPNHVESNIVLKKSNIKKETRETILSLREDNDVQGSMSRTEQLYGKGLKRRLIEVENNIHYTTTM